MTNRITDHNKKYPLYDHGFEPDESLEASQPRSALQKISHLFFMVISGKYRALVQCQRLSESLASKVTEYHSFIDSETRDPVKVDLQRRLIEADLHRFFNEVGRIYKLYNPSTLTKRPFPVELVAPLHGMHAPQ